MIANPPMAVVDARISLVLGGARSGKSAFAETLIARHPGEKIYIATAEARDDEMRDRIAHHQARRGGGWRTIEVPLALGDAILREALPHRTLLVECLTLWLANVIESGAALDGAVSDLEHALNAAGGRVVLVANEVGLGIVPENVLARRFADELGRLNQRIAALADAVYFVAAGLPMVLKQPLALPLATRA